MEGTDSLVPAMAMRRTMLASRSTTVGSAGGASMSPGGAAAEAATGDAMSAAFSGPPTSGSSPGSAETYNQLSEAQLILRVHLHAPKKPEVLYGWTWWAAGC